MPCQHSYEGEGGACGVPQEDGAVLASGGQKAAVVGESDEPDLVSVLVEDVGGPAWDVTVVTHVIRKQRHSCGRLVVV